MLIDIQDDDHFMSVDELVAACYEQYRKDAEEDENVRKGYDNLMIYKDYQAIFEAGVALAAEKALVNARNVLIRFLTEGDDQFTIETGK